MKILLATLLALVPVYPSDRGGGGGDRGSGECSGSEGQCSDDDLSPRFDDSPIIICLRPDSCRF